MSHLASLLGRDNSDHHRDSSRVRFRRALLLCLMTIVAPGWAQVSVGNRVVGRIALTAWFALLCGGAFLTWKYRTDRAALIGYFTDGDILILARAGLIIVVVLWLALFVDAWRLGSPFRLTSMHAALITTINLAIIGGVAGSTAFASQLMEVQREVVTTVFKATKTSAPLEGRYNILLVGSDARKDRTGVRPDSLTVVSIDTSTGRTVLVSLPRNLQNVPFADDSPMREVYPDGYNCGETCLLNAVYTDAQNRPDLYPGSTQPGLEATIDAVEGVTDLKINYYVMVDLKGFKSLVDAVGGVKIDVKTRIAMFGLEDAYKNVYIEPGVQQLGGQEALWYARSRFRSNDYVRMGRQKCLMAAMLDQLSPQKVLLNATEIGNSGKELLSTNIPAKELGQFADLALRSRGEKIATVSLVPPAVVTSAPDFPAIRTLISKAIDKSERSGTVPEPSKSPKDPSARAANMTDDLSAVC